MFIRVRIDKSLVVVVDSKGRFSIDIKKTKKQVRQQQRKTRDLEYM